MTDDDGGSLPSRKRPVHGVKHVEGQPTIVFDTLCMKKRRRVLACDHFHLAFRSIAAAATAWRLGRYVIMPDHIHFFAGHAGGDVPYENWVRYLKSQLTKQTSPGGRGSGRAAAPGTRFAARQEPRPPIPTASDGIGWLSDHWDTRIRTADAYEQKWHYVLQNPVRTGLVMRSEDWPYQGEIFELRW